MSRHGCLGVIASTIIFTAVVCILIWLSVLVWTVIAH